VGHGRRMKAKNDKNPSGVPDRRNFIPMEPVPPFVRTSSKTTGLKQAPELIAEDDNPDKDRPIEAVIIGSAAEQLARVYPAEDVEEAMKYLAALRAAREMTGQPPAVLPSGLGEEVSEDTRLDRLRARYERRLLAMVLPPDGFTTKAQAKAAARLATTLRRLQKVQAELGLPVTERPALVKKAESMRMSYKRHHNKTEETTVRPRGRPRRTAIE